MFGYNMNGKMSFASKSPVIGVMLHVCTVTMLLNTPQGANRLSRNERAKEIPNLQADICNNHARSKLFSAVKARGSWSTCPFFKRIESKHIVVNSKPSGAVTDFG